MYHGIVLNNVADSEVSENEVSDSGYDGIALYGGTTDNEVKENEVSDSGRYGVSLRGEANDNLVKENEVSESGTGMELAQGTFGRKTNTTLPTCLRLPGIETVIRRGGQGLSPALFIYQAQCAKELIAQIARL